ncbi:MAG: hypothetical protein WCA82_16175 [Jiangellales bacterium]
MLQNVSPARVPACERPAIAKSQLDVAVGWLNDSDRLNWVRGFWVVELGWGIHQTSVPLAEQHQSRLATLVCQVAEPVEVLVPPDAQSGQHLEMSWTPASSLIRRS